jgi:hypothetical protein
MLPAKNPQFRHPSWFGKLAMEKAPCNSGIYGTNLAFLAVVIIKTLVGVNWM